jgi:hypothetical protein
MRYPVIFALMTALFFGLYGPSLAQARSALHSPFKPYFAIGLAYLVWATLGGTIAMKLNGDAFTFTGQGITWGFIAGSMGAFGALTLTLAMFTGGGAMPHIVMPIVFGGATTVTALVALRSAEHVSPWLGLGIVMVAIGIVLVAYNTPHAAPPATPAAAENGQADH